jgi:flagellar biosynthetic protein FliR
MNTLHLDQIVRAVMFAGVRIGGLLVFAPFFGSESIAWPIKAGFTAFLTALLYPAYAGLRLTGDAWGWVGVVGGEVLIGLLLGLSLQFIFDAAGLAGQIVGLQTGFSLVNILDPQTQVDTPVFSVFHQMIALLIFLQLNVHHWLLRGLAASFAYLPAGAESGFGSTAGWGLAGTLLRAASAIWLVGLQIAAPVMVATMLVDIAMGFLGKASPQLPVLFFGLSLKSLLGLTVLVGTLALWPRLFERHFAAAVGLGEHWLHLAR